MRYRTSRSTHASGRAAKVSRVSHEGQVFGFNHATSGSSTPRALSQRERGMPLTAAVRRTLGLTNGRPGVKSTIWRAPTRSTACTPAWTSRARWTYSTVAAISGKKLSNLASIDVGVQIAISHFGRNPPFSPGFDPAEALKSAETAGDCQGRILKRKSLGRYCRLSHVPFCRSR
jgi:hypothetical protein